MLALVETSGCQSPADWLPGASGLHWVYDGADICIGGLSSKSWAPAHRCFLLHVYSVLSSVVPT